MRRASLDTLRALDRADDPDEPSGFNWQRADAQFRELIAALNDRLGVALENAEGTESIQGASFHGQALLPTSVLRPGTREPVLLCASNFGRLVAVRPEGAVAPEALATILAVLDAQGYTYVDATLQDVPYDGPTRLDPPHPTWWTRYFEYNPLAS